MIVPPLTSVSSRLAGVYRVRAAIGAIVLLAGIAMGSQALSLRGVSTFGLPFVAWALFAIWWVGIRPRALARAWGWRLDDGDFHVAGGVLFRAHTIVPVFRVQHIDMAQGPVERAFGLASLVVHTAGVASTAVVLPGLLEAEAAALRDAVRARMTMPDE